MDHDQLRRPGRALGAASRLENAPERAASSSAGSQSDAQSVSPEKMMRLLTPRNLSLLHMIASRAPSSLTELARISGRPKASLTRTMQRFRSLGLVSFKASKGKGKIPVLACKAVRIEIALDRPGGTAAQLGESEKGAG